MASSCDSAKMQLSAIFKLEFYKNKKDWKLSKDGTDRRKKPLASPRTTDKPDKTHGLGEEHRNPEFDEEQVSSDKVSLHEETDDIPDLPGPEVRDIPGSKVPDIPGPEVPDIPGPGVPNLPRPEVSELPGPEFQELPGPEVADLPGPEVLDLLWPEVSDLPGPEVSELPGPEFQDLPGPEAADLPRPEVLDLLWPEVSDLPGPEVSELPGPEFQELPGPEVADLPGPEVLDLLWPEVSDLPGPEVSELPGPEFQDLPGPEVADLPRPEVLDLLWPEVSDLLWPEISDLPGPEVSELPGPEFQDFPGPEVTDLPGPEVLDLLWPEVPDLPGPEVSELHGPEFQNFPGPEVANPPGLEVRDLLWPEVPDLLAPEVLDFPGPEAPDQNLYRLHSSSGQPHSGDGAEALGQYTQLSAPQPYWQDRCETEIAGILEELACDQYNGPGQHYLKASDAAGHEWLQKGYSLYKEEFTSLYDEDQGLPKLEIQVFDTPDPPITAVLSCSVEVPAQDMSELLDDTTNFMRGAHLALHSSEIDLNTTEECSCIGQDNLWALSVKQLARAIQLHELALTLLLEEGARRDELSAHSEPYSRVSSDDGVVICDTNRLWPPDAILPGGYCAPSGSDSTGRGRGRLQQARKQYDTTY